MTAEIAIMNRQGVALAADSAATVQLTGGQKIYNTVNKLFMLSNQAPVGIMIYGNSTITGVPWEIIVKEYRKDLGDKTYKRLSDYSESFISFIQDHPSFFPISQQKDEFSGHAFGLFNQVLESIKREIRGLFESQGDVRHGQVRQIVARHIRDELAKVEAQSDLPRVPHDYCDSLQRSFRREIEEAIDVVFETMPVGDVGRRRLRQLICRFMIKDAFPNISSGIVIAGYGEEEHFPRVQAFDTQSVLLKFVKQRKVNEGTVGYDENMAGAAVFPFAQREMVDLFMRGVAPQYRKFIEVTVGEFLAGLPKLMPASGSSTGSSQSVRRASALSKRLTSAMDTIAKNLAQKLDQFSLQNHVNPILDAVAMLPKEELADMAESLVNLTSFKRRVTMDPETVGGPIDVAVISKGDGFIWIKRKQYFEPGLNHHVVAGYYK